MKFFFTGPRKMVQELAEAHFKIKVFRNTVEEFEVELKAVKINVDSEEEIEELFDFYCQVIDELYEEEKYDSYEEEYGSDEPAYEKFHKGGRKDQ